MYEFKWNIKIGLLCVSWAKDYERDFMKFTETYADESLVFLRIYKLCLTKFKRV